MIITLLREEEMILLDIKFIIIIFYNLQQRMKGQFLRIGKVILENTIRL